MQSHPSQQQPQSQLHHDRESDDGNLDHSADENDGETHLDHEEQTRNGKRKRPLSVSCELCKQRKVKCDRGQPSCGWCSRNGALCEYKERKKPGLRAGYGRELEQRLDRLEEILRTHSEILQQTFSGGQQQQQQPQQQQSNGPASVINSNASLASDQGTPRDMGPVIFRQNEPMRTPQAETALFLQKPTLHAGPTPTQSMDYALPPQPSSMQTTHDPLPAPIAVTGVSPQHAHLPNLQTASGNQDFFGQPQQTQQLHSPTLNMSHSQAHISSDQEFPPYDLLYALADLYFKHINTWCPILHRKVTLDSLFGPSPLDETDKILLHAIVATTIRYSADQRLTDEKRKHYHGMSKQKVLLYGMEHASVKSLQALVILALDLIGDGNGPPGWNIMAIITRAVVQLGLSVETTSLTVSPNVKSIYTLRAMILPESRDFIEEESRRRLFWMVYLLDRYATIATAFEFALDDREIDRTLPCRDDLWMKNQKVETRWFRTDEPQIDPQPDRYDNPENLGAFSYYIEILGILSKIHKFLKQPVDISALSDVERWQMRYKELDHTLSTWKFGLPGEYGNMAKLYQPGAKALNCMWVMLHATYHTAVVRLHSSAAYPTHRSPIFQASYTASQRCHQAVENIHALAEFAVNNGLLQKLGPPFAFSLWVAARLLLVHGSTVEHKLSPHISFLVDSLREMGRYWPVAQRYSELLSRVLDEQSDADRTGEALPSSVRILSDMRRTAFDLDFLISRQPRHNQFPNLLAPGGANGGGGNGSRLPSVTPQSRTPAPNELEYLDVFDFFNVPRLPFGGADMSGGGASGPGGTQQPMDGAGNVEMTGAGPSMSEFNITNFTVDANSDWLFKQEGKFMA